MNRRKARKAHLIRRARERFKLRLDNNDLIEIKKQISNRTAVLLKDTPTKQTWLICYKGVYMRAGYDALRNQMTTFMEP